ncbi:semaphorin-4C-like isoform X3 [Lampetra fluviatilis]
MGGVPLVVGGPAPPHWPLIWVALVTWGPCTWAHERGVRDDTFAVPRSTIPHHALGSAVRRVAVRVGGGGALALSPDGATLLVGACEGLVVLNAHQLDRQPRTIVWNATTASKEECIRKGRHPEKECLNFVRVLHFVNASHLYTCGTHAFDPQCTYVDMRSLQLLLPTETGRGRCPYHPTQPFSSLMDDGDLYTATVSNFLGSESVIARSMGSRPHLKTEPLSSWLNEPTFAGSAFVREDDDGGADGGDGDNGDEDDDDDEDDDKIYFFFSETAKEYDFYTRPRVARVARVCKGDVGGLRTLQRRWTSFLKSHLECGATPHTPPHLLSQVRGAQLSRGTLYLLLTGGPTSRLSAVCVYRMADVRAAFRGSYRHHDDGTRKWITYPRSGVPDPRPGACVSAGVRARGFPRSSSLPDRTLSFALEHPLMFSSVRPTNPASPTNTTTADSIADFTTTVAAILAVHGDSLAAIAVTHVEVATATTKATAYPVLYLAGERGVLYKAVLIGSLSHIIEETHLFPEPQPISRLLLSANQRTVFVLAEASCLQLPTASCSRLASCADCILARDPHCGWDARTRTCRHTHSHRGGRLLQNVETGITAGVCDVTRTDTTVPLHDIPVSPWLPAIFLPCPLTSNLARATWMHDLRPLMPGQGPLGVPTRQDPGQEPPGPPPTPSPRRLVVASDLEPHPGVRAVGGSPLNRGPLPEAPLPAGPLAATSARATPRWVPVAPREGPPGLLVFTDGGGAELSRVAGEYRCWEEEGDARRAVAAFRLVAGAAGGPAGSPAASCRVQCAVYLPGWLLMAAAVTVLAASTLYVHRRRDRESGEGKENGAPGVSNGNISHTPSEAHVIQSDTSVKSSDTHIDTRQHAQTDARTDTTTDDTRQHTHTETVPGTGTHTQTQTCTQ